MGIFDGLSKILGGSAEKEQPTSLDEVMEAVDTEGVDAVSPPAERYVKKVDLAFERDITKVKDELNEGNILIVDLSALVKYPEKANKYLQHLKGYIEKTNGDMARLSESTVIITPSNIKIVKTRRKKK